MPHKHHTAQKIKRPSLEETPPHSESMTTGRPVDPRCKVLRPMVRRGPSLWTSQPPSRSRDAKARGDAASCVTRACLPLANSRLDS